MTIEQTAELHQLESIMTALAGTDLVEPDVVLELTEDALVVLFNQGYDRPALDKCRSRVICAMMEGIGANFFRKILSIAEQCSSQRSRKGFVYALEDSNGMVKIGRTINPQKRLRCIETQSGKKCARSYVSKKVADYDKKELAIHKHFSAHRTHGEWFDVSLDDVIAQISQLH